MPRYEHKCIKDICEFLFEVTYRITEDPAINCPKCASPTKRQVSSNVMFETPMDAEWLDDPRTLNPKSIAQAQKASKQKYRW